MDFFCTILFQRFAEFQTKKDSIIILTDEKCDLWIWRNVQQDLCLLLRSGLYCLILRDPYVARDCSLFSGIVPDTTRMWQIKNMTDVEFDRWRIWQMKEYGRWRIWQMKNITDERIWQMKNMTDKEYDKWRMWQMYLGIWKMNNVTDKEYDK